MSVTGRPAVCSARSSSPGESGFSPGAPKAARISTRRRSSAAGTASASRAESATLGGELDQVSAYLDVLAVRMGARLRHRIETDPACRTLPIAPMLLQPLVENAVMHGIEPKLAGGEIVVRTRVDGDANMSWTRLGVLDVLHGEHIRPPELADDCGLHDECSSSLLRPDPMPDIRPVKRPRGPAAMSMAPRSS